MATKTNEIGVGGWIGLLLAAILIGKACGRDSANREIEKVKTSRAESSIENRPVMIDSQTMVTSTTSDATSTTYQLKMINLPSSSIDSNFLVRAQEVIGRRNCADRDIRSYYDQGMFMKYVISGSDNHQAGSFIISNIYCQKFGN